MYTLRISNYLHEAIEELLYLTDDDDAKIDRVDIMKMTARAILKNGVNALQKEIPETYCKSGKNQIPIRNFQLPQGCDTKTFRKILAARVLEAIEKIKEQKRNETPIVLDQSAKKIQYKEW